MATSLFIIAGLVAFLSVPTMIAARMAGVGNTGFAPCLAATFLAVLGSQVIESMLPTQLHLASALQFMLCTGLFVLLLRATVIQGALVAILLLAIQFGAIVGIAALGYAYLGKA